MEVKRIEELERILEEKCGAYEDDCRTCPHKTECAEYIKLALEEGKNEAKLF